jgi:hypothetical protein
MNSRTFVIVSLTLGLFLGLFGTAFAGEGEYKSLLGTDEFVFDAPLTKADLAAANYQYNQEQLSVIGTERGELPFSFNDRTSSANDQMAVEGRKESPICTNC